MIGEPAGMLLCPGILTLDPHSGRLWDAASEDCLSNVQVWWLSTHQGGPNEHQCLRVGQVEHESPEYAMRQAIMDNLASRIVLGVVQVLLGGRQAGPGCACHQPDEECGQELHHRHCLDPADSSKILQGKLHVNSVRGLLKAVTRSFTTVTTLTVRTRPF